MKILSSVFKHFGQIFSVFSVIILCLGYLSLSIYYSNYGIDIWHFIGVSEIVLLSLKFIFDGIYFLFIQFLLVTYAITDIIDCNKEGKSIFDWLKRKYVIRNAIILFILFIVSGLIVKYYPSGWDMLFRNIEIQILLYFLSFIFIPFLFAKIELKFEEIFIRIALIFLFQMFCVMIILPANENSFLTQSPQVSKADFLIKDSFLISTPDSIKFIGNTSNYYFFYNSKKKTTTIYPSSSISKIQYENIERFNPSKK